LPEQAKKGGFSQFDHKRFHFNRNKRAAQTSI